MFWLDFNQSFKSGCGKSYELTNHFSLGVASHKSNWSKINQNNNIICIFSSQNNDFWIFKFFLLLNKYDHRLTGLAELHYV